MYRHILVPVDDSRLSIEVAAKAVSFARSIGARITFFHARSDFGATDEGALVRVMSPQEYPEQAAGNARAVLAKAEADARACGVAYESVARTSDRPYEGIIDTAGERGCDLIFMASHGRRGFRELFLGSQTQKVLAHTTISVLVCSVEANDPSPEMTAAIGVIKGEHRSMAAVIDGLKHTLQHARDAGEAADTQLLQAMVRYFHAFPESLHHPKEEEYVFARLRERAPEFDSLLQDLHSQHEQEAAYLGAIDQALGRYRDSPAPERLESLMQATDRYAEFIWEHMSMEEKDVIPACQQHFTSEDWKLIADAFEKNSDPRFEKERAAGFDRLFARIMNLAERNREQS